MPKSSSPFRILIEANKLLSPGNDGIKRYLTELLISLAQLEYELAPKFEIHLYIKGGHSIKLSEYLSIKSKNKPAIDTQIKAKSQLEGSFEYQALRIKDIIRQALPWSIFKPLAWVYEHLPIRFLLSVFREWEIQRELNLIRPYLERYDLIHVPLPQNLLFLPNVKSKFLITIHDFSHKHFPQFHTNDNINRTEQGMQQAINSKTHFLAVSQSTKLDLLNEYPVQSDRVHVVYEACNRNHFRPHKDPEQLKSILEKYRLPKCPFFLCLSTLEPRKNLVNTIKAFNALQLEHPNENLALFICGKRGWNLDDLLKKEHISTKNIFFVGYVAEEDLPIFYSHALALCYVSFYEGFGLPPLEAMACGTTIIYGDNSSMKEIIGDAGLPADPYDVDNIRDQMEVLFNDDKLRIRLQQKALKRAAQFSWAKVARETLAMYEKLI